MYRTMRKLFVRLWGVSLVLLCMSMATPALAQYNPQIVTVAPCDGPNSPNCGFLADGVKAGDYFVIVVSTDQRLTDAELGGIKVRIDGNDNSPSQPAIRRTQANTYEVVYGPINFPTGSRHDVGVVVAGFYTGPQQFTMGFAGPTPTPTPTNGVTPTPTPTVRGTPTPTITVGVSSNLDCASQGLQEDKPTGLCLPTNPYNASSDSLAKATSVGDLIKRILNILLTLGTVIAVLFIVIGGYQYLTSRGSEDQAKAGRKTITYAVLGLFATLAAYMLVTVATNLFTQGRLF
jgi:hypothetical protein